MPFLRQKFPRTESTVVLPGGPLIPILALVLSLGLLASATTGNLLAGLAGLVIGGVLYVLRRK